MTDYTKIFCDNINWVREQRGMTRQELATLVGVSGALLTEITKGTANPTLKIMEAIAQGLALPLPLLLKSRESDEWQFALTMVDTAKIAPATPHVPQGYELLEQVVLPLPKAEVVKEWLAAPRRGRPRKQD